MVKVDFFNQTSTSFNKTDARNAIRQVVESNLGRGDFYVSVALLKRNKVTKIAKIYLKESEKEAKNHPVLSFLAGEVESEFVFPPGEVRYLGEIIVSVEKCLQESKQKKTTFQERLEYWLKHSTYHLCGIHHD